jgi:transposase
VIDRLTGERRTAQIFVAVLGASSFTYAGDLDKPVSF